MSAGFYFKIYNGLLEPKHVESMGEAVWLYMWLQEKNTSTNENGEGKVLGNKPIKYEDDIKPVLGISRQTYVRWVDRLRQADYIKTLRTPAGLVIVITKAKKHDKKGSTKNDTSLANTIQSDVSKMDSDVPNTSIDVPNTSIQYKTRQGQDKDNTNIHVKSATPTTQKSDNKILFNQLVQELGFSDQVKATPGRLTKLRSRLKTFAMEDLLKVAVNIRADAYMQGDNTAGKRYGTIDYLLRSDEKVDEWLHARGNKLNNIKADW